MLGPKSTKIRFLQISISIGFVQSIIFLKNLTNEIFQGHLLLNHLISLCKFPHCYVRM
jgi:hypothetical protein